MNAILRKLRGMIGVGITWGAVWAAAGALLGVVIGILSPEQLDGNEGPLLFARILGVAGFISGASFALLLSVLERGRTLRDVSLSRVALWGAAAGAVIPLLTTVADNQVIWTSPLGAILATSSVALARRAELTQPARDPELPSKL